VILNLIFGSLAVLSFALLLWQWLAARRFPLHQRITTASNVGNPPPAVTLLKPLKGCDESTEACLRSWFAQDYAAPVQILFAVVSPDDPVCKILQRLRAEFPSRDADVIVVSQFVGANAKVSKLVELQKLAKHDIIVVSDADVRVPADFLKNAVVPLANPEVGLVNCFYRLANPSTLAMQWEAIAINADFWSQVLQSKALKPLDFALGAVMMTRLRNLEEIGGFATLANCLADDYQLGNRIAREGHRIELCPVVVECWDSPMNWSAVWKHQLRWARTIRVCQPAPYFLSILSNSGLWAIAWMMYSLTSDFPSAEFLSNTHGFSIHVAASKGLIASAVFLFVRILVAVDLQWQLTGLFAHIAYAWLVPIKDLLQTAIWFCAFVGNRIEWRGRKFTLLRDGTLVAAGE
jgi:ceramide glucosyltransferase